MSPPPPGSGGGGSADLVLIARLGRPHGVAGALHATATGPTLATLVAGDELVLRDRDGSHTPARVSAIRGADPRMLLEIEGVTSREEAAALTGALVLVPASRLPAPGDPATFYVRDLVGFGVRAEGRLLGIVTGVHPAPANDALEVGAPGGEVLVPFTVDAVVRLDRDARLIELRDGLLPDWAWGPPGAS